MSEETAPAQSNKSEGSGGGKRRRRRRRRRRDDEPRGNRRLTELSDDLLEVVPKIFSSLDSVVTNSPS